MPLTDEVIPFHLRLVPGQDTKNRDTLLETNKVETVQNARFENEVGSVFKRSPAAKYNSTSMGSGAVHSEYRYYTKTTQYLLAAHESSVYVGNDSTGVMTLLKAGFTSGKKFTFEVYKDLCLLSNGYEDIQVTDGTAMWELGACRAETIAGGSNLDASSTYSYQVTLDNDQYVCGAISNIVTTGAAGGNRKVTLTNIPLGPLGTTNRKIYRTSGNGTHGTHSEYHLIATISNNIDTTYVDDIADTTVTDIPAVTDDMPKGRYIKTYRERLFVARSETNPSRIYYSNPFLPGYIQGTSNSDYGDISPDDGDVITGIPLLLGTMCVFKRNTIRKWNIDSADPNGWVVDDPISFEGCPAPYSIAQTPYGIVYKGWRHMQNFDGAFSRPIIDEFDVVDDIQSASQSLCVGFWHGVEYLLSYVSSESSSDSFDKIMRFNWLRNQVEIDTINVASFTALTGDDEAGELYYGDSINGYVYLAENYEKTISLKTMTQLNGNQAYPSVIFSGLEDISFSGSEEEPVMEIGWTQTINGVLGDINYPDNHLSNFSFETGTPPSNWTLSGAGASVSRSNTQSKHGTYSAAVVRSGANCTYYQTIHGTLGITYWQGRTVTFGCWVYSTATGASVSIYDGLTKTAGLTPHSGTTGWEWLTVTATIDASATEVRAMCEVTDSDKTVYFDSACVTEGPSIQTAIIDRPDTNGTYTSDTFKIDAKEMGKIYWNESLGDHGSISFYTRSGATEAACLAASWGSALTNSNGSTIDASAGDYFQFKAVLSTTDITETPSVYYSDGYVIKFTYSKESTSTMENVPFCYGTGYRNFGQPGTDKLFKKIVVVHSGVGSYTLSWETDEGYSGSWTVNMTTYPRVFETFFPSMAYGRKIKFTVTKNDKNDFTLKEIMGLWTPRPVII